MIINIRQPLSFSEIGRKDNQEDNVYPSAQDLNTENRFFILCDGMGGHDNGEVASDTVCHALGHYFETNMPADGIVTTDYFKEALAYAYDELDKKDNGSVKKMGTTMTCLYLHKKGYLVAHIGDSRIYHVRPANTDLANERLGIIYQSSDHSLVNDLLKAGELTEEEAVNFPQKNIITRAMQPNLERRYKADVFSFSDIQSGDYFFLCSDGVLEQLTNERLCEILSDTSVTDNEKLESIRQVCYDKTKDNYTCYLIPIDKVVSEDEDDTHDDELIVAGVELEEEKSETNDNNAENDDEVQLINQKDEHSEKKHSSLWKWILIVLCVMAALVLFISTCFGGKNENKNIESKSPANIEKVKDIMTNSKNIDTVNIGIDTEE